jgi:hypothetical protein
MGISIPTDIQIGETTRSKRRRRVLDFSQSGPFSAFLLLAAVVAFWPSYLSRIGASTAYTHLHAFTATLWLVLLIAQPMSIRSGNLAWHRTLGSISYGLVPIILLSVIFLAHSHITGLEGEAFAGQAYALYLRVSLVGVFGLAFALAMVKRKTMALHARFMICTAFTLIDPVVVRLLLWADPTPDWNFQWLTFGLTDLVILAIIWLERESRSGKWVFPAMLVAFVLSQIPALLGITSLHAWQEFARWFAELPLT